jgi:acetyl-CoA synthetase
MKAQTPISSKLAETRTFKLADRIFKAAHIKSESQYQKLWRESVNRPNNFWRREAKKNIVWIKNFAKVLEWKCPSAKWFVGGKLNASVNCIDRHVENGKQNKAAIIWEGENGDTRTLTYNDLLREVSQCANALQQLGVNSGDRVSIFLPLIPEAVIAMLACARIGAMHNVIFAGFSSEALAERNNDSGAKVLITADGGYRRGSVLDLKSVADIALEKSHTIAKVLVVKRLGSKTNMKSGRDFWWHELVATQKNTFKPYAADSEHPLFLLYTSGSTGKPKGIVHTTAGYLLGATLSSRYVFDLKDSDTFWCTADVGWVTGHSYVAYGPLSNGSTILLYEGAPNYPDWSRFWKIIEKHRVSVFYTAPTAIRSFMKAGDEFPNSCDLSSLRLLGTVGEPINPEAWVWYFNTIGKKRCPIVDTWWQTETGGIMISPLPGVTTLIAGSATKPFFGVDPEIVDKNGTKVMKGDGGFLVIKKPWPSMLRTIWNDDKRFVDQYWSQVPGKYFTGDGARQDKKGNFWILGRIDDVLNVSGHRLSTMEIESALVSYQGVAEAAVVGKPDALKGEAIVCFVTLKHKEVITNDLVDRLKKHVALQIGGLARPDVIRFTDSLPKTRSGKIMRRLLRDIAAGKESTQDTSTLEDLTVLANLREEDA